MKITGIVAEYNPFHLGHHFHLSKAIENTNCDGTLCIMSGNFVQRGMPALIDKWSRAKIAVLNGVDLVIELPLIYSVSSAEGFSEGAIKLLDSTGVVDYLYYGCEHNNNNDLITISNILHENSNNYKSILKDNLNKGLPFHKSRELALYELIPNLSHTNILSNSNNILAIEYLKAIQKLNSSIIPISLQRQGSNYNDILLSENNFSSATSIRQSLKNQNNILQLKNTLPSITYDYLNQLLNENYKFVYPEDMFLYLKFKLITEGHSLCSLDGTREGLDNKILKEIINSSSFDEFIHNIKSKRYTYTRISRILTSFFIGLENYSLSDIEEKSEAYIRPLAFNTRGREILKSIKEKGKIEIITKVPRKSTNQMLSLDLLGTRAYSILNPSISPLDDYLRSPFYYDGK